MSLFSHRFRSGAAVGLSLALAFAGIAVAPAASAGEPTPSPAASVTAVTTPSPSSPDPTVVPSPSSVAVDTQPSPAPGARAATGVSISGHVVFDGRTNAAQRASVEIWARAKGGLGMGAGRTTYDPATGAFAIADVPAGDYRIFAGMRPPGGGWFVPEKDTYVSVTSAAVSGVSIDFLVSKGGIHADIAMVIDDSVRATDFRFVARDVKTGAETTAPMWGAIGEMMADVALPTGTTVTVRAEHTDGRVVYYDGTSTGSSDPARAVTVTTGLWEWKNITLDWAAAAAPKLASSTPTISGTARVGRALTVTTGVWARGATLSYQWSADGAAVRGATAASFTPRAAQKGKRITVTVTGALAGYTSVSRTSKPTAAVAAGILTAPTPTISGTARVGKPLTAVAGSWTSGTTLTYQWSANGTRIAGATSATFTPTTAQRGKKITVAVTGKKSGYTSRTVTSTPTPAVAR